MGTDRELQRFPFLVRQAILALYARAPELVASSGAERRDVALHLYAAARLLDGDAATARDILAEAGSVPWSPGDRDWHRRLWQLIEERAENAEAAGFAREVLGRLDEAASEGDRTGR